MSGWKPYSIDLATEVHALTSWRAELVDVLSFVGFWLILLHFAQ